jgi:hypothetical protein
MDLLKKIRSNPNLLNLEHNLKKIKTQNKKEFSGKMQD